MLLFNPNPHNPQHTAVRISKHLMLLFNTFTRSEPFFVNIFQNISCYCLTGNNDHDRELFLISKHLMLLFNALLPSDGLLANLFQNISCYCLTAPNGGYVSALPLFQNISCYCLTGVPKSTIHRIAKFQNISCYCLTGARRINKTD